MIKNKKMKKIILEIVEKIKDSYLPEKIILFGSYAYGNPTKESDIDILVVKKTNERPIDRRIKVRRLVNLKVPVAFSPIVMTPDEVKYLIEIGDHSIKEIMKKGKILYG
ncbi:MAG: nucleotidyltransferase domain-containing protein [Candidatus Thermoplasmatota archaeon]